MVTVSAGRGALLHCSNWVRGGSVTLSLVLYHLTLQELCRRQKVVADESWLKAVQKYEKDVLLKR